MEETETIDELPVFTKKNVTDEGLPILKKKELSSTTSSEPSIGAPESELESISPTEPYKYSFDEIKSAKVEVKPVSTFQVTITPAAKETTKEVNEKERIGDILKEAFIDNNGIYDSPQESVAEERRNDLYKKIYPALKKAGYNISDWSGMKVEGDQIFGSAKTLRIANEKLKENPDNEDWQYAAAVSESELGRNKEARDKYENIIAKNPKMASAYTGLAYIYGNTGQNPMALSIMDDAVTNNPENGELYHNRAIYKQRVEDYAGALKDLERGATIAGKTKDKGLLANIYEQRTRIWGKLSADKPLAQKYIDIIKGDDDPTNDIIDQEYFKEQYKEDFNNARRFKISTKHDVQLAKEKLFAEREKAITEGRPVSFEEQPPTIASANIKDWEHSTAFVEAIDDLLLNPQKAGFAGLLMNPVGGILGAGVESISAGLKEVKKGVEEIEPVKILKGAMETAIGTIMTVTPVGWAFTGAVTAAAESPYTEYAASLIMAPVTTIMKAIRPDIEPGDIAGIADLVVGGILLHKANQKLSGAKRVAEKIEAKEPITTEDALTLQKATENIEKKDLEGIIQEAGLKPKEAEAKPTEVTKPPIEVAEDINKEVERIKGEIAPERIQKMVSGETDASKKPYYLLTKNELIDERNRIESKEEITKLDKERLRDMGKQAIKFGKPLSQLEKELIKPEVVPEEIPPIVPPEAKVEHKPIVEPVSPAVVASEMKPVSEEIKPVEAKEPQIFF